MAVAGVDVELLALSATGQAEVTLLAEGEAASRLVDAARVHELAPDHVVIVLALPPSRRQNGGVVNVVAGGVVTGSLIQAGDIAGPVTFGRGSVQIGGTGPGAVRVRALLPAGTRVTLTGPPSAVRAYGEGLTVIIPEPGDQR